MTDIEILESTYFDKCTIKRKEKIKNPNINLQEGDTVEVSSMGKISNYLASKPFYYSSHSETLLSYKERA